MLPPFECSSSEMPAKLYRFISRMSYVHTLIAPQQRAAWSRSVTHCNYGLGEMLTRVFKIFPYTKDIRLWSSASNSRVCRPRRPRRAGAMEALVELKTSKSKPKMQWDDLYESLPRTLWLHMVSFHTWITYTRRQCHSKRSELHVPHDDTSQVSHLVTHVHYLRQRCVIRSHLSTPLRELQQLLFKLFLQQSSVLYPSVSSP